MNKKKLALLLISTAVLAGVLAGCAHRTNKVRIGTAGKDGSYYTYGTMLGKLLEKADKKMKFTVKETAGSAANLRLLSDKYLELGLTQSDVAEQMYYGTGAFEEEAHSEYGAVAALYTEACQLVVRADSDIASVDDLLGKTVSIGEEGSGTQYNAREVLECSGLSDEMLHIKELTYDEAAQALKNQAIDAFFCTAGAPTNVITKLADEIPVRLIGLDERQTERIMKRHKCYLSVTIPADTYPGQETEIQTIGVRAILAAGNHMLQEDVYNILLSLYENSEAFGPEWSLENAAQGITIPYHPGAAQFMEEHGIEITEDEGE